MKDFIKELNFISAYNDNSPLFLRKANDLISKNEANSAIVILKKGLQKFPDHPVAHILLGKAFLLNGNYGLAESSFKRAGEMLGSPETYQYYLDELNKTKNPGSSAVDFQQDIDSAALQRIASGTENRKDQITETKAIEDRLEQLAEMISSARIQRKKDDGPSGSDILYGIPERSKIVSETLAKIYLSQGEKSEAIKVYEKLIKRNPAKESYYLDKIREIRSS